MHFSGLCCLNCTFVFQGIEFRTLGGGHFLFESVSCKNTNTDCSHLKKLQPWSLLLENDTSHLNTFPQPYGQIKIDRAT